VTPNSGKEPDPSTLCGKFRLREKVQLKRSGGHFFCHSKSQACPRPVQLGVKSLKDLTLTICNHMFGLLGPNRAGKSTLMRTVATLQDPDSGTVQLDDLNFLTQKDEVRKFSAICRRSSELAQEQRNRSQHRNYLLLLRWKIHVNDISTHAKIPFDSSYSSEG
jgi:ABC-type uncharacterized transport system ATPase subunit